MRRVNVEFLKSGMKVARTIYDSDGRILLGAEMELTQKFIGRLSEIGIASVYIKDDMFELDEIPEVISEQTRLETVKLVKESFQSLDIKRRMNVRAVRKIVDGLIDELLSNREILINLTDIRSYDDYTFSHSVNVCILSIITGITLGYHELKLKELGVGALLHDVGKTKIDKEILNKPGELDPDELEIVKKHAEHGFEILRTYDDVPLLSAHIAFQHHERWDGKGYPRRLREEEIHEYSRIVAVADVYDALLADRPYRSSYSINQAITIISRMSNTYFEPRSSAALISNIAIFPIGSVVMISTGEYGLVVDVNKETPTRPVIRILFDKNAKRVRSPHEIDLTKLSTIYVTKVLTEKEVVELLEQPNPLG